MTMHTNLKIALDTYKIKDSGDLKELILKNDKLNTKLLDMVCTSLFEYMDLIEHLNNLINE